MSVRRSGSSLVEMVVSMGAASLVLGVGIGMLHLLMRTERMASAAIEQQRTIARLSRVFREDVHAAREVALVGEGEEANARDGLRLELQLGDGIGVEYRLGQRRLDRVLRDGDVARHRDRFVFPADALIEAEHDGGSETVLLRLALPRTAHLAGTGSAGTAQPATVVRLQAIVGRDRRWNGDAQ